MKKVLVSIPNFGTNQLECLKKVVEVFQKFDASRYHIDIVIHSNIALDIEGAQTRVIKHLDDWWDLPFVARTWVADKCNDYDLYIYNENDQAITQDNVEAVLEMSSVLPMHYIPGFIRYENGKNTRYFPEFHNPFRWRKRVLKFGRYLFAQHTNNHQGSFVLTKKQLHYVMQRLDFYRKNKVSFYRQAERVGTDIYHCAGLTRLICISNFERILIHHLPDKYLDWGQDFNMVRQTIEELKSSSVDAGLYMHYFNQFKDLIERFFNYYAYNNRVTGKLRRELLKPFTKR